MPKSAQLAVLELGSNGLGEITELTTLARPEVGIITGLGTAHIGKFGSAKNLAQEKMSLLLGLTGKRIAIVRQADLPSRERRNKRAGSEVALFLYR